MQANEVLLKAYVIAKFFQGGGYRTKMKIWSDENEKLVGKFFVRLRRAKKGVPKSSTTVQGVRKWNVFFENATVAKLLNILT